MNNLPSYNDLNIKPLEDELFRLKNKSIDILNELRELFEEKNKMEDEDQIIVIQKDINIKELSHTDIKKQIKAINIKIDELKNQKIVENSDNKLDKILEKINNNDILEVVSDLKKELIQQKSSINNLKKELISQKSSIINPSNINKQFIKVNEQIIYIHDTIYILNDGYFENNDEAIKKLEITINNPSLVLTEPQLLDLYKDRKLPIVKIYTDKNSNGNRIINDRNLKKSIEDVIIKPIQQNSEHYVKKSPVIISSKTQSELNKSQVISRTIHHMSSGYLVFDTGNIIMFGNITKQDCEIINELTSGINCILDISISPYFQHTIILLDNNTVITYGTNTAECNIPPNIQGKVIKVFAHTNTSYYLLNDNTIAVASNDKDIFIVPEIIQGRVVDLSVGFNHAFAMLDDGSIFYWGKEKLLIPKYINGEFVVKIIYNNINTDTEPMYYLLACGKLVPHKNTNIIKKEIQGRIKDVRYTSKGVYALLNDNTMTTILPYFDDNEKPYLIQSYLQGEIAEMLDYDYVKLINGKIIPCF